MYLFFVKWQNLVLFLLLKKLEKKNQYDQGFTLKMWVIPGTTSI